MRAPADEPADRELRDRAGAARDRAGGSRADEPRPVVAVVVFPGSNDDRDAQLALTRLGAAGAARLARRRRAARTERQPSSSRAGSRSATTSAAARSPAPRRSCARSSAFADAGGLVLGICNGFQILTEARLLPGVLRANAIAQLRLPRRRAARRAGRHAVHARCERREPARADDPGQERRGLLVRRRGAARRARGERPDRAALRTRRQPERSRRRRRRGRERRRERLRPDAASRARRRPAARLDRRRADPRLAGRRGRERGRSQLWASDAAVYRHHLRALRRGAPPAPASARAPCAAVRRRAPAA